MKELLQFHFSLSGFLIAVLGGLGLIIAFRLANHYLQSERIDFRGKNHLRRLSPHIQAGVGVLYFLWAISTIFSDSLLSILFTVLLVIFCFYRFSQYVLKDFFAGMRVKANKDITGKKVRFGERFMGRIARLGWLSLELSQEDLTVMQIPYHQVAGLPLVILREGREENRIQLSLVLPPERETDQILQQLKRYLLTSPYIPPGQEPQIRLVEESDGRVEVKIETWLIAPEKKTALLRELKKLVEQA
ncbi:MAG: hypothetical protein Kow0042_15560 [Calditrichia bacterium]